MMTKENEPITAMRDGGYIVQHIGKAYVVRDTDPFGAYSIAEVRKYLADNSIVPLEEPPESQPSSDQLRSAELETLVAYLASTDWYIARYVETGIAIPDEVRASRAAARTRIDELRA